MNFIVIVNEKIYQNRQVKIINKLLFIKISFS